MLTDRVEHAQHPVKSILKTKPNPSSQHNEQKSRGYEEDGVGEEEDGTMESSIMDGGVSSQTSCARA
jgi:hypothetical protein